MLLDSMHTDSVQGWGREWAGGGLVESMTLSVRRAATI